MLVSKKLFNSCLLECFKHIITVTAIALKFIVFIEGDTEKKLKETEDEKERMMKEKDDEIADLQHSMMVLERDYKRILDVRNLILISVANNDF